MWSIDFFFFLRRDHGRLPAQAFKAKLAHVEKKEGGKIMLGCYIEGSHNYMFMCIWMEEVCR